MQLCIKTSTMNESMCNELLETTTIPDNLLNSTDSILDEESEKKWFQHKVYLIFMFSGLMIAFSIMMMRVYKALFVNRISNSFNGGARLEEEGIEEFVYSTELDELSPPIFTADMGALKASAEEEADPKQKQTEF